MCVLVMIVVSRLAFPASAGVWSGETEVGGAMKSSPFVSQYFLYDASALHPVPYNLFLRYFGIGQTVQRGEFALGPTLDVASVTAKFQLGVTTDLQAIVATRLATSLYGRSVVYIGDAKLGGSRRHNTFYQKAFVALVPYDTLHKRSSFYLRVEDLVSDSEHEFLRLGAEYQYQKSRKQGLHFFLAPFYDPINTEVGAQGGMRFFDF